MFVEVVAGPELKTGRAELALKGAELVAVAVDDDGCEKYGDWIVKPCILVVGVCTGTLLKCADVADDGIMRGWILGFAPEV